MNTRDPGTEERPFACDGTRHKAAQECNKAAERNDRKQASLPFGGCFIGSIEVHASWGEREMGEPGPAVFTQGEKVLCFHNAVLNDAQVCNFAHTHT